MQGTINQWNDNKGYGFILASDGRRLFVHISEFNNTLQRPTAGLAVSFSLGKDRQGKVCAVKVNLAAEENARSRKREHSTTLQRRSWLKKFNLAWFILLSSIVTLLILVGFGWLPKHLLVIYLLLSIITFAAYAADKSSAREGAWRIPENTLHILALFGGWPGGLLAQQVFRHKSSKLSFQLKFWSITSINCVLVVWLTTEQGSKHLELITKLIDNFIEFLIVLANNLTN